eukprot:5517789-Prymnesium_polylepis.1
MGGWPPPPAPPGARGPAQGQPSEADVAELLRRSAAIGGAIVQGGAALAQRRRPQRSAGGAAVAGERVRCSRAASATCRRSAGRRARPRRPGACACGTSGAATAAGGAAAARTQSWGCRMIFECGTVLVDVLEQDNCEFKVGTVRVMFVCSLLFWSRRPTDLYSMCWACAPPATSVLSGCSCCDLRAHCLGAIEAAGAGARRAVRLQLYEAAETADGRRRQCGKHGPDGRPGTVRRPPGRPEAEPAADEVEEQLEVQAAPLEPGAQR